MSRRDLIKDLYAPVDTEKLAAANSPAEDAPERVLSGPVRSMGLSLGRMEEESRHLQEALAAGANVIELDTKLIDASFIRDRFPEGEADFEAFKLSIAERGQEVPILVRPHPTDEGRYQLAYGHRRTRACAALGRKVRAVVRALSDMELVIAQGIENSQRKDLSYIERAIFAVRLEDKGFERSVICDSLATDKGELSKLISVARAVPETIIQTIGPAPKAGRRRWLALMDATQNAAALRALELAAKDPNLATADTDARFLRLFSAALAACEAGDKTKPKGDVCRAENGVHLATLSRSGSKISLTFDEQTAPKFAEFVRERLEGLYDQYRVTNPLAAPVMKAPKTATDG